MRSRTIDLDGPVHFADFGGSGPPMVLVHGLGGCHVNWAPVGPALATRARVVAPDLAGFGRTPLAGRPASVEANLRLLDRFLDAVADGPAILVGNSMGGLIAMMEAAHHPAKVERLVLVGPAQPRPAMRSLDPVVALAFATYAVPGLGETLLRWRTARLGPEGTVHQSLALCCADAASLSPDIVAGHVAMAVERQAMPWAHAAFIEAARSLVAVTGRRRRLRALMAAIQAPTLIVQGTQDRLVPLAASRATAALRPDWSLAVLDGVGHVPQLEAPARFVETVTGWLDGEERDTRAATGVR